MLKFELRPRSFSAALTPLIGLLLAVGSCSDGSSKSASVGSWEAAGSGVGGGFAVKSGGTGAGGIGAANTGLGGATPLSAGGGTSNSGGAPSLPACTSAQAAAIFTQACGTSPCHEGSEPAAGLDLISAGFEDRLKDANATLCSGWRWVTPGVAEASLLYQKVVADTPPCGVRMPVGNPLPADQIQCLKSWIESLAGTQPPPVCETCGTTRCIDVTQDSNHCGACGVACAQGQVCQNSQCVGCSGGELSCSGACVNPQTNAANCGGCGKVCGAGQICLAGSCQCGSSISVSYAQAVQPIFTASCGGGNCHIPSRGRAAAGLDLGVAVGYNSLVNVNATQCSSRKLVLPGNPSESYVMDKLLGVRLCVGTAMPKAQPSLSQQELDTIGSWICGGARP